VHYGKSAFPYLGKTLLARYGNHAFYNPDPPTALDWAEAPASCLRLLLSPLASAAARPILARFDGRWPGPLAARVGQP